MGLHIVFSSEEVLSGQGIVSCFSHRYTGPCRAIVSHGCRSYLSCAALNCHGIAGLFCSLPGNNGAEQPTYLVALELLLTHNNRETLLTITGKQGHSESEQ